MDGEEKREREGEEDGDDAANIFRGSDFALYVAELAGFYVFPPLRKNTGIALATRWRTRNGLECHCLGDAAISIAVLHHLSTESRRKKAIDELIRVVKKGGLVLITVYAVEQEDRSLVNEWTPPMDKHIEEWIGPSDPCMRIPPSLTLESIPKAEENSMGKNIMDTSLIMKLPKLCMQLLEAKVTYWQLKMEKRLKTSKSFSSLGICLIHRAEVGGFSTCALANGLGKKDDKKGAVVYNRYYHVFSEEKSSSLKQLNGTDVLNRHKTKKEVMEEIMSKIKYFKVEKAKEKEENEHLVDELTKLSHP
ncbi:hypothetical protein RHSIM_Rhsim10G0118000 [Rhododendron simsii]|uniref:Methyltransferase type 11 domain-containing protein n=1 Tax=Rhododendron simsii TaxID=118357 RepID=A0A834G9H3_RHOSS|nr:hypothetical protein RHSIM_Rhsim10G0118000 [Rhododendron simsii]